ncbi:calcium-binding protein [Collimonas sp.]|jgi:Ca2+-binding RTX toxin-like protein/GH24 family phage-related lysozyme (muramidase)|uniref:calcium-binding protein n=1 Tax=Collimonas sp. TaxID=1963772 RepID=UPI002CA45B30|nr:calcium-binding protein [Collimonas sp.]HWW04223.1 calcium-binding protein [Collimonas sp.]
MSIAPTVLTQANYEALRFALIGQVEGIVYTPYFDKVGIITIGIGFNIDTGNANTRAAVMSAMGLTSTQQSAVNTLWDSVALANIRSMAPGKARDGALSSLLAQTVGTSTFAMTDSTMLQVFNGIVDGKDKTAQNATGIVAPSFERAVLASLEYNSKYAPGNPKGLIGPGLLRALKLSDPAEARAEAWYQLRYNSGNQYKRRYEESALFGLYQNQNNISAQDALAVFKVYTRHRGDAMNAQWDTTHAQEIGLANADMHAIGQTLATLTAQVALPSVDTLTVELGYGEAPLFDYLKQQYLGDSEITQSLLVSAFNSTNIYAAGDTDQILDVRPYQTGSFAQGATNLLIGGGGNDMLIGGAGSDLLIGGSGNASLVAGSGNETLVGGTGNDTMIGYTNGNDTFVYVGRGAGVDHILDTSGQGTVWINDKQIGAHTTAVKGQNFSWTDNLDGQTLYQFNEHAKGSNTGTLTISLGLLGSNGGQIVIDDFDLNKAETGTNGYLGIHLREQSAIVAGIGNASAPFNYNPTDASVTAQGAIQALTIYASATSTAAQTVTLALSGGDPSKYSVNTGADMLSFGNGTVTLTIPAGQDSVTVGLAYVGDITQSSTVQVTSTLVDPSNSSNNSSVSNKLTVTYDNSHAPKDSTNTVSGVLDSGHYYGTATDVDYVYGMGDNKDDLVVTGPGPNVIEGGTGNNVVIGNGEQNIIFSGNGNSGVYAGTQVDLATAITNAKTATATGQKGDLIAVGNGNNTVVGGNGNDAIFAGAGNNVIVCGPGNDTVLGGLYASYAKLDWGVAVINNVIQPNDVSFASLAYTAPPHYEGNVDTTGVPSGLGNATIFGGSGNDLIETSNGNNYVDAGSGNSSIFGGMGNDTIFGGTGNVTLSGGGGDDYIDCESGNDSAQGGSGNNTLIGGSGNDRLFAGRSGADWARSEAGNNYVEAGSGNTIVFGAGGNDTLIGGSGKTTIYGGSGNEYIEGGSGQNELHSNSGTNYIDGSDTLVAGDGNTTIYGGQGTDFIYGGNGVDTIYGGTGTTVIEAGDGGTADKRTQVFAGSGDTTITGGSGFDIINGGSGKNVIYAGGGGTTAAPTQIIAGSGATTVYGGNGIANIDASAASSAYLVGGGFDTLVGGGGNDTLIAGSGSDLLKGGGGSNIYQIGADSGNVEIQSSSGSDIVRFGTGIHVSDLTVTAGFGRDGGPALIIDDGAGGELTIDGGLDGAINQFSFADGSTATLAQLMALANSNPTDLPGVNGNLIFSATNGDVLVGGAGNDTLYGWSKNQTLQAGSGTATLISYVGNDSLIGSSGNNIFRVHTNTDTIVAQAGANNTVESTVSYVLPANVDKLTGIGSADLALIGNDLNDVITANSGNDTLIAGSGVATLVGGSGNDTFVINNVADVVNAQAGGINTVLTSVNYVAPSNVQNLTGIGSADLTLTGNDLANVITANHGNDTLIASNGIATLIGGIGNDTFVVNNAADTIVSQPNQGIDTVVSSVSYGLASNVANLTLTGTTDLTATGNALDNVITANDGNDTLFGGFGHDTLIGGAGHDTFLMGFDMGESTVIDTSSQGGTIKLEDGVGFSDLSATRLGNDLLLNLHGSGASMRLQDYYLGSQNWNVDNASGDSTTPQALLDATAQASTDQIGQLWNAFYAGTKGQLINSYLERGYVMQADGSLYQSYQLPGYANHDWLTARDDSTSQVITDTYLGTRTTVSSSWNPVDSYSYGVSIVDHSAAIYAAITTSDDQVVVVDPSLGQSQNIGTRWLGMVWGATVMPYRGSSYTNQTSGSDPIYGSTASDSNNIVGWRSWVSVNTYTTSFYDGVSNGVVLTAPGILSTSGTLPQAVAAQYVQNQETNKIQEVQLGAGDHTVYANALTMVVGGAGNSQIFDAGLVYLSTGNNYVSNAQTVYGGAGNDTMIGGETLIAGLGDDLLIGGSTMLAGSGSDQIFAGPSNAAIVIDPMKAGADLIGGDGNSMAFLDAYYQSMGVSGWRDRYRHGGKYDLVENGYYDAQGAEAELSRTGRTLQQALKDGSALYVAPLPVLVQLNDNSLNLQLSNYYATADVAVVALSANDFPALAPYQNFLPVHKLVFDAGVSLSDLRFSWGTANASMSGTGSVSTHATLNISWGTTGVVEVLIPHFDDPIGSGISEFDFADGSKISMADIVALAPLAPSFDPQLKDYVFQSGAGEQVLNQPTKQIQFGGIAPSLVTIARDGTDLILSIGNTGDSVRLTAWYGNPNAYIKAVATFADGTNWSEQFLTQQGLIQDGSSGNQTLHGLTGYANTFIAGANDTLIGGGSGNDLYRFNAGAGAVHITDSSDTGTIQFGVGITADQISLNLESNLGSLILKVGNNGDTIYIDGFDPSNVLGSSGVSTFRFADGTTLSLNQLLAGGFDIYGTNSDEILNGTSVNDRLHAGNGNDTLVGGQGNDVLIAGAGIDVFNFSSGDGQDTIDETAKTRAVTGTDVIAFENGISASSLKFKIQGTDLLITYGTRGDSILVKNPMAVGKITFADGSYTTYANDGQGKTTLTTYRANATVLGNISLSDDVNGNQNNVWQNADGTHGTDTHNVDGSGAGTSYAADGSHNSYVIDTQGDVTTTFFNASGNKLRDSWLKADGTSGQDVFNANGSSSGATHRTDGSYSKYTNDGMGNIVTTNYDVINNKVSDSWTKADGTYGNDTFNLDGSRNAYTNDGLGNARSVKYDVNGNIAGDSWQKADGTHGTDIYSRNDVNHILDDIISTTYGSHGDVINVTTARFDASGNKTDDIWTKPDGSTGSDTFHADGSSSGTTKSADGSYSSYAADGHGDVTTTNFDTNGSKISDSWSYSGGSHGTDMFNADGSSSGISYNSDGSYYTYTQDASGNSYAELDYGANGDKQSDNWYDADGSSGQDVFNADGSSSGTNYNPDGSYSEYTNDGQGDITANNYSSSGILNGQTVVADHGYNNVTLGDGTDSVTVGNGGSSIQVGNGDDLITLGSGSNSVTLGSGTDRVVLGNGVDTLQLGSGVDTVVIGANAGKLSDTGQATVVASPTGTSELLFANANSDQLWFQRSGDDLDIGVIGTSFQLDVSSWYGSSSNHVQSIVAADGKTLIDSQVDALVSAMASFNPPASGATVLPDAYQNQLRPVIAANWH